LEAEAGHGFPWPAMAAVPVAPLLRLLGNRSASPDGLALNGSLPLPNSTTSSPANGTAHGAVFGANGLVSNLLLNSAVVVLGLTVWKAMRLCGVAGPPRSQRGDEASLCGRGPGLQSTVARNYITFLTQCRNMFSAMTVMSAAMTVPHWGPSPIAMGIIGTQATTTKNLAYDSTGLAILCLDTALRGVVALVFVERLQRRIQPRVLQDHEQDRIRRTLWLSDLPVYDRETREAFEFYGEDFKRVGEDLKYAINAELRNSTIGLFTPANMEVHVAPVVDRWFHTSLRLRNVQERMEVYRALSQVPSTGCCSAMVRLWHARQQRQYAKWAAALSKQLDGIVRGPKHISGSAFITFQRPDDRDYFLRKRPHWWKCQSHTYFKFGRPPFASATLSCTRAPHPGDVNWMNLHVETLYQKLRGGILTILLFVVMVLLVTPVTVSSQLNVVMQEVKNEVEEHAKRLHCMHVVRFVKSRWVDMATTQLPSMVLVVINSLLLPDLIQRIAVFVKPHRKSTVEVIQLHLNAAFLIMNSMVIPFLGLESINGLLEWANLRMKHHPAEMVQKLIERVGDQLMHTPGIFALRYILNCACLTNVNSLLQVPQLIGRAHARSAARTARESVEAEEAWVFAWGYWYAWTISIFTIGICASTAVPSVLPFTAVFFTLQHTVDKYNLTHRIYSHGPDIETENLLTTRVLHYMRCVIAFWWFFMGMVFWVVMKQGLIQNWDSSVPVDLIWAAAIALIVLSVCLVIFSLVSQHSFLHDNSFQHVNLSERGLSNTGGGMFQPICHNIERCLKCSCCRRGGKGKYSAVGARLDRQDSSSAAEDGRDLLAGPEAAVAAPLASAEESEADLLSWDARSVVIQPVESCGPL